MRQWCLLAWGMLTAGIGLGAWWAYRELGWGGWWFWDPVENASLLPWLAGTGLLHTLALVEKRKLYPKWTLFLAMLTFTLSLIGTFLVRSGVLTSVHAFANDPERGVFILMILGILAGLGFTLLGMRAITARKTTPYGLFSRENMLMVESLLLFVACATVLLGTLYPMAMQVFDLRAVSVGYPYYNAIFLPLTVASLLLATISPTMKWQTDKFQRVSAILWPLALFAALISLALLLFPVMRQWETQALTFSALFLMLGCLRELHHKRRLLPKPLLHSRSLVVHMAHLGLAVLVIGTVGSVFGQREKEVSLKPGTTVVFEGFIINHARTDQGQTEDYHTLTPVLEVFKEHDYLGTLKPQKRRYPVQQTTTFEVDRLNPWWGELYAVAGDSTADGVFGIRLYRQPLIDFVWFGFMLIAVSAILGAVGSLKHKSA